MAPKDAGRLDARDLLALIQALPGMVYRIVRDPAGSLRFEFVSSGARRIFGPDAERELFEDGALARWTHPEDLPGLVAAVEESGRELRPFEWEGRLLRDQVMRVIQARALPSRRSEGSVEWNGMIWDVTENFEIRREAERIRQIVDSAPDAISYVDRSGMTLYMNRASRALFGVPLTGPIPPRNGEAGLERLRAAHPDWAADLLLHVGIPEAEREGVWQGETAVWRSLPGGGRAEIPVHQTILAHRDSLTGEVTHFSTRIRDMTEARRAQRQIETERARAEHASRLASLGEMAAGIAHEINNPLAIISASAAQIGLHLDQSDEVSARSAADRIVATCERIAKIVRGLRALSHDGSRDPFESVDLRQVVSDTLEICRARFQDRKIAVELLWPEGEVPRVRGRPVELAQIALNLLNNAADALVGRPDAKVTVDLARVDGQVRLIIADNGPGVPAAIRRRIMEPFFTTKAPGKGTGLGLAISSAIASAHGGRLSLDEHAPGARFVLELPTAEMDSQRDA